MDNLYQKSFYEMVGSVGNIETQLSKLMISDDQGQNIMMLSEIWRHADNAQTNLGQLPLSHLSLERIQKFLNQLGDYCYYLIKKAGEGKPLTVEEMDNLRQLHNSCVRLNNDLRVLENRINEGGVKFEEIHLKGNRQADEVSEDIITRQFTKIEQVGMEYPRLIYDGPFSETVLQGKKVSLTGKAVTQAEANQIAVSFVGKDRVKEVKSSSEGKGDIETWGVYIETRDQESPIYVSVSKKGGKVINMVGDAGKQKARMSIEDARKQGQKLLEERGFPGMTPTYQQYYDGIAVINYAYEEDGIIFYPDLIKVKLSLEDGRLLGFEAMNYWIAHKERKLDEPKLSLEEAEKLVSGEMNIKSSRLAVIPTDSGGERLCYEFRGTFGNENFIVYIDAYTGEEADILKIIDTENGNLVL